MGRAFAVLLLLLFVAAFVVVLSLKIAAFAVKLAILAVLALVALGVVARLRRPARHETLADPDERELVHHR